MAGAGVIGTLYYLFAYLAVDVFGSYLVVNIILAALTVPNFFFPVYVIRQLAADSYTMRESPLEPIELATLEKEDPEMPKKDDTEETSVASEESSDKEGSGAQAETARDESKQEA